MPLTTGDPNVADFVNRLEAKVVALEAQVAMLMKGAARVARDERPAPTPQPVAAVTKPAKEPDDDNPQTKSGRY